ncbi:MAG: N-acetylglucosamine kinase [Halarsenatibacteraceae bacterium]
MYLVGIDAGGSKTRVLVVQAKNKKLVGEAYGVGANFQELGAAESARVIAETCKLALDPVLLWEDRRKVDVKIGAGVAGCGREEEQRALRNELNQLMVFNDLIIEDDGKTALLSAWYGKPGIVLIAGTGSIAYALDNAGLFYRSGGWGPLLGDAGSGCWLGLKGLGNALKRSDRRDKDDKLKLLFENLNEEVHDQDQLVSFIYQNENIPRKELAGLAPFILDQAEKGDQFFLEIVEAGAQELAAEVTGLALKMPVEDRKIALAGGLINNDFYREKISSLIESASVEIKLIKKIELEPVFGALYLAETLI